MSNRSLSSSSWGLGRAAVCDCGTPWTFLLPFFFFSSKTNFIDFIQTMQKSEEEIQ